MQKTISGIISSRRGSATSEYVTLAATLLVVASLLLMIAGRMDATSTIHNLALGMPAGNEGGGSVTYPGGGEQSPEEPEQPAPGDGEDGPDDGSDDPEGDDPDEFDKRACSGGGLVSLGAFSAGGHNLVGSGFCVHGDRSLSYGSHNEVRAGARVSTSDLSNVSLGQSNIGFDAALSAAEYSPGLSAQADAIISRVAAGSVPMPDLPDYITKGPVYLNEMKPNMTYSPGTFYLVNGPVSFRSGVLISEVMIYARDGISVGSKSVLDDVVFVSPGKISLAAKAEVGTDEEGEVAESDGGDTVLGIGTPCRERFYSVVMVAGDGVSFGAQSQIRGAQLISRGSVSLAAQSLSGEGLYVETLGSISQGSHHTLSGCSGGLESRFGPTKWSAGDW